MTTALLLLGAHIPAFPHTAAPCGYPIAAFGIEMKR